MPHYKKEEREMVENAKKYFIDHSPKTIEQRLSAKTDEVVTFYHDMGMIYTPEDHGIMWNILKKLAAEPEKIETHEDISKKKAEDEKEAKKIAKETAAEKAAEEAEKEALKALEEARKKKEELRAEKEAKIKELEEKKARLEEQAKNI